MGIMGLIDAYRISEKLLSHRQTVRELLGERQFGARMEKLALLIEQLERETGLQGFEAILAADLPDDAKHWLAICQAGRDEQAAGGAKQETEKRLMSTNCIHCLVRDRTAPDLLCDVCRKEMIAEASAALERLNADQAAGGGAKQETENGTKPT